MAPRLMHIVAIDPYLRDWLGLLIRSLHVIAAIGWIGGSFYFVHLDQSLRFPKDVADREAGVGGELWEVHGGGFYHVQKYRIAPHELPDHLAWFKWEAYATWLSGFALLVLLYWLDARAYLIDKTVADIGPWTAVGISAGLLVLAWLVYDVLCRALKGREALLGVAIFAGTALAAWGNEQLFSPRAAWLQTGAMLGTVMAASVLINIIPAHWELIRAKEAGREPDPAPGVEAKRRSVHNNYLTLPVLATMLAGHFSFLTGRQHAWLILLVLMIVGAWVRHFYNLRHAGRTHWWMLVAAAAAITVLAVVLIPSGGPPSAPATPAQVAAGRAVFASSACVTCHTLADAGATGTVGPNLDQAKPVASLVIDRVTNGQGGMPSFKGKLSTAEIAAVAAYVSTVAGR
ncbi:MAG: urate hydroxylase PuuD [Gaiellaceae bacterium]